MKHLFPATFMFVSLLTFRSSIAQKSRLDSLFLQADTTAVMDSLMKDFDDFLDSLIKPKSFFNISVGIGTGSFSFKNYTSFDINIKKRALLSSTIGYYHKSGLGLSVMGNFIKPKGDFNLYQYAISPSYDYVKQHNFSTGISFTRYYTKQNLSFYTTPIQKELYTYFNFKKWWLQPGLALSYGWGNKTEYEEKEVEIFLRRLQASKKGVIYIKHDESVKDLSMLFSLRHNFEWYELLCKKDILTFTPALLLSAGTQNFGLNTSFSSDSKFINNNFLPGNSYITDVQGFDLQSATLVLRVDYSIGKFYVLPQLLLDYYLHQSDKRFNNVYSISFGCNF